MVTGLYLIGRYVGVDDASGRFRRLLLKRDQSKYEDRVDFSFVNEYGEPTRIAADLERLCPQEGEVLAVLVAADARHDANRNKDYVNWRGLTVRRAAEAARLLADEAEARAEGREGKPNVVEIAGSGRGA